jgi:CRISPR-associated endoribonuclease Cas6
MRLVVRGLLERETAFPINHQELLAGLVYHLLAASDPDYARFLHDEGYRYADDRAKRFKLFTFSWLHARRRRVSGGTLFLGPGPVEWFLCSPVHDFLVHGATGLLAAGNALRVGRAALPIEGVESLPPPVFGETTHFTCLSPIVATVPRPEGGTHYLRPSEAEKFSEAVRRNLLKKHELLYGAPPKDECLRLEFNAAYLARDVRHGGTKKITIKNTEHIGAFAPFTLTGSPDLMQVGWECGLGEKNSAGFGMVAECAP